MSFAETAIDLIKREYLYLRYKSSPVLYDHVSKCAGVSIYTFLKQFYPYRKTFGINGSTPETSVKEFLSYSPSKRSNYKFLHGHLARGLFDVCQKDLVYATTLRDPVDRIVSHYHYVKADVLNHLHAPLIDQQIELKDYCAFGLTRELENWYVMYFSGLSREAINSAPEEAIELAYKNLINDYTLIGFQDAIPAFLQELSNSCNLPIKSINVHKNQSVNRPKVNELTSEVIEGITKYNSLDIKLYKRLLLNRQDGCIKKVNS